MMKYVQQLTNNVQGANTPVFLLIGGQSNTGTNTTEVSNQYPMGRVNYSLIPSYLQGEQTDQKIWNGTDFSNFEQPTTEQYGWINHFLYLCNQKGFIPYIYKWGQGGNQLTTGGPYSVYPREELKDNGLAAWNKFKTDYPDGEIAFLWCQGFTDALDLSNSQGYDVVLSDWFGEVRTHFSLPDMNVFFNGISDNASAATYRAILESKQIEVGNESTRNIFINANGLDFQDGAHYSNVGVKGLADRYFEKFILRYSN